MGSPTMDSWELRQAFDLIDVDKDGYVTAEELIKVVEKVGGCMSQDEARSLIRKADSDKDGCIDFTEFKSLWTSMKGEEEDKIKEEFSKYDTDKNGVITKDEMLEMVSILSNDKKSEAQRFIAQLDVDNDGKVSYPEFLLVWRYRDLGSLDLPL